MVAVSAGASADMEFRHLASRISSMTQPPSMCLEPRSPLGSVRPWAICGPTSRCRGHVVALVQVRGGCSAILQRS